jgi:hypothetical protein
MPVVRAQRASVMATDPRPLTCFKAYDIRGRLGVDLDEAIAHRIGRGFARALDARRVVLARVDVQISTGALSVLRQSRSKCARSNLHASSGEPLPDLPWV